MADLVAYRLIGPDIDILEELAGELASAQMAESEQKEAAIRLKRLIGRARENPYDPDMP